MPGPGDRVGEYVLERPLGRGGEATVFQARHAHSGAPAVVKILEPAQLGEVAAYERFRREVIETCRRLPVARALRIAASLAEVVAYCHAHRVYHRDLKPENILVDREDRVKIIDFGIALLEGAPRVTWRGFSGLVGTPAYMAPEQIRGERGGPYTDVYAIGIILYEMLAGAPPYRSVNPLATMYQHLNMVPDPLQSLRDDVPAWLAAVVARAMRRRKEERFPSARELYDALTHPDTVDLSILGRPDPPLGAPPREGVLRHPLVILGIVALATAVLVLLAEVFLRR